MKTLLTNWNLMRVIRLALGVILIVQGVSNREALYFVLGGALALMALANAGCCGAGGCAVDTPRNAPQKQEDIIYEEVDQSK